MSISMLLTIYPLDYIMLSPGRHGDGQVITCRPKGVHTMAAIRFRVPYELAIHANDLASAKKVTNIWYGACGDFVPGPQPGYGTPVAGSDTSNVLTSFQTLYEANIVPLLNANYKLLDYTLRAIVGKQYGTPFRAISSVVGGAPVTIQTSTPHGYATGNSVSVSGVTTPTGVNGSWIITVVDGSTFTLDGSTASGAWSGSGQVQRIKGQLQFTYADQEVLASSAVGGSAGDALPLFATASVRRISSGTGRNYRSRLSFSPFTEADALNGRWTTTFRTNMATALTAMRTGNWNNDGSGTGSEHTMFTLVVSKQQAFTQSSPFAERNPWSRILSNYVLQPNQGSLTRRKPRLTASIL